MLLSHQRLRAGFAAAPAKAHRRSPPTHHSLAARRDDAAPAADDAAAPAAAATTTTRRASLLASVAAAAAAAGSPIFSLPGIARAATGKGAEEGAARVGAKFVHTEDEWRAILRAGAEAAAAHGGGGGGNAEPGADFRYKVLRYAATERPLSSALYKEKRKGTYVCAGCGSPVYRSEAKYNSGTGWPSFFEAVDGAVERNVDDSIPFMVRDELRCAACAGHLGHVFDDGPPPTYERHCINGAAMRFRPDDLSLLQPGDDDGKAQLAIVSKM